MRSPSDRDDALVRAEWVSVGVDFDASLRFIANSVDALAALANDCAAQFARDGHLKLTHICEIINGIKPELL